MAEAIRAGRLRTLVVFGEDVTRHGIPADALQRLETLVASDILPNATTRAAHWVLPGCAHAEKRGTFTNVRGRVQRFFQALQPPGAARPESEFLVELLALMGDTDLPRNLPALFNRLAAEVAPFKGMTWAGLGEQGMEGRTES
jgi:predicted molibdopterin-dependent oxidoreductase YjgC